MHRLYTTKDLAVLMQLHPRTVKRWWHRLRVPPDACSGHGCHRWSERAKARLLKRWQGYWHKRGFKPADMSPKFAGALKRNRDRQQLSLPLFR